MADICLVVMCGLPASGKSTLCKQLLNDLEKGEQSLPYKYIVVEYDELLPPEIEKSLIQRDEGSLQESEMKSPWKQYRQDIYTCVDCLIYMLKETDNTSQTVIPECFKDLLNMDLWILVRDKSCTKKVWDHKDNPVCIVIDDNMYYGSMRYSYYQLARKYNTGFCQIYLQTKPEIAIIQNKQRVSNSVTEKTIVHMAKRFEEPKPFENSWEQNTLTLNNMLDWNNTLRKYIQHIINQALRSPVENWPEVDTEAANQSREICSANFLHQSDQVLRKLVSKEMVKAKVTGTTKSEMKNFSENLLLVRKQLIDNLKEGEVLIPQHIVSMTTDASKDESSPLFVFLKDLFYEKQNAIT